MKLSMTKDRCELKRSRDNKVEAYPLPRDDLSSIIPYCTFEQHPGILTPNAYKKCRRKRCYYLAIFRPEGIEQEAQKKNEFIISFLK